MGYVTDPGASGPGYQPGKQWDVKNQRYIDEPTGHAYVPGMQWRDDDGIDMPQPPPSMGSLSPPGGSPPPPAAPTLDDDHVETQVPAAPPTLAGDHTETPVAPSGGAAPTGPAAPAVDPQAAKDAAFARAKDKIGLDTRASMTALRESLAGRGALGSGVEGGGMASLLGEGAGNLSDVVSNQTAYDVAGNNARADRNYEGALKQRGQNLGVSQSLLSLLGGAY